MQTLTTSDAVTPSRVRDLMTRQVVLARDHDTVAFASQILCWRGIRHLPIVDAHERLVGIVSDRDLLRYVVEGPAGALELRAVMSTPVETVGPDDDVDEARALLARSRIDCLPVVRHGRVVGILTSWDVLADRGRLVRRRGRVPSAGDLMIRRVLVAHRDDPLLGALQKLIDADVRHLPVVDEEHRVVGILSDRDVRTAIGDPQVAMGRASEEILEGLCVGDVMTPDPITVGTEVPIVRAAELFVDERIGALPVVSADDRLLGILSYVDVIAHFTGRRPRA